jgi:phosphatidylethanolamine/phosphatidyl-N-methylethanolamine N-methyltransferase
MATSLEFWSHFAARYDGHVVSKDAVVLAPRIAAAVGPMARVLDAGCGTGQVTLELARVVTHVDAVDFSEAMVAVARTKAQGLKNVTFHTSSVERLGFPNEIFDAVVLSNVLHLVDDPAKALTEARRVLKPSGKLIAPTYCHGEGIGSMFLSRFMGLLFRVPVRTRWRVADFMELVQSSGFEIMSSEVVHFKMPLLFVVAAPGRK